MAGKLLIATGNPGKLAEYRVLLEGLEAELTDPVREGIDIHVEEDGATYRENALKKAVAYAEASGLMTLADDSGLEVDALGGEPGLRTARFGGEGLSDQERVAYLLRRLEGVPWERRGALFRCIIIVAYSLGGLTQEFEGVCEGRIALDPRGENGFGYDPVFFYPPFQKTMAELSEEQKHRVSHRGKAARAAAAALKDLL